MKNLNESNGFTRELAQQAQEAKLAEAYRIFYNACEKIAQSKLDLDSGLMTETGAFLFGEENTKTVIALNETLKRKTAICIDAQHLGAINSTYHTANSNVKNTKESFIAFLITLSQSSSGSKKGLATELHEIVSSIHSSFSSFFTGSMAKWVNTPYDAQRDKTANKNAVLAITAVQHLITAWLAFVESYDKLINALSAVLENKDLVNGITHSGSNAKLLVVFTRALELNDPTAFSRLLPAIVTFMKDFTAIKADVEKWQAGIEQFTGSIKSGTYGDVAVKGKNDWEKLSQIETKFQLIENEIKGKLHKRVSAREKTQKIISARAKELGLSL